MSLVSVSMQPCITFPRQEIKVGPTHQAVVPDHPTFPPYAKGKPQDDLLWTPRHTTEERGRGGRWREVEEGGRGGRWREGGMGREVERPRIGVERSRWKD